MNNDQSVWSRRKQAAAKQLLKVVVWRQGAQHLPNSYQMIKYLVQSFLKVQYLARFNNMEQKLEKVFCFLFFTSYSFFSYCAGLGNLSPLI